LLSQQEKAKGTLLRGNTMEPREDVQTLADHGISERMAEWFGMSQPSASQWKSIVEHRAKLIGATNKLPASSDSIARLISLDAIDQARPDMTQQEIAAVLGVSHQTVSLWIDEGATNSNVGNGCAPILDARVKIALSRAGRPGRSYWFRRATGNAGSRPRARGGGETCASCAAFSCVAPTRAGREISSTSYYRDKKYRAHARGEASSVKSETRFGFAPRPSAGGGRM
jgi:DNA-binding transcriptional regulator YiaG